MTQRADCFRSCTSRRACLVAFMLVSALLLGTWGCERHDATRSQKERPPTWVTVVTVTPGDVPVSSEYIAQMQSSRQANIQARVNGLLNKCVYTEGAVVKEGQVLFLMD